MNQKGFTTVEVLVCFVIVSVIMMSLFSTISSFNEKKIQESYRARVYEYKNMITNTIQEDFIKRGLSYAKIVDDGNPPGADEGKTYTVYLTFRDGSEKQLKVHQRFTKTPYRIEGNPKKDDDFYIDYGTPEDMNHMELPNLGESKGYYPSEEPNAVYMPAEADGKCYNGINGTGGVSSKCFVSKNFQINNIAISITNEADPDVESHVLNIYIGFYHPNLGTKYAVNIVAPIDYQSSTVDQGIGFGKINTKPTGADVGRKIYIPSI